jgi:hypothetical protein
MSPDRLPIIPFEQWTSAGIPNINRMLDLLSTTSAPPSEEIAFPRRMVPNADRCPQS